MKDSTRDILIEFIMIIGMLFLCFLCGFVFVACLIVDILLIPFNFIILMTNIILGRKIINMPKIININFKGEKQ